ncbi:RNA polymerase factor sigma-54 [Radiobacillus deserti]|nr:RNA polymerase factor sigma-54 [Radiobacillus deserti]
MQKPVLVQSLQRKMTQQLSQSIELLQMNTMEIHQFVQEIADENPLIEAIEYPYEGKSHQFEVNADEVTSCPLPSFYDQIKEQLLDYNLSPAKQKLVEYGIDNLDEDGYLTISLEKWSEDCRVSVDEVSHALEMIQSLEPKGIGAREVSECLSLQLRARFPEDEIAQKLVETHLDWVAQSNTKQIGNAFGVSEAIAKESIEHIKCCHPKPGQLLIHSSGDYITPDAEIIRNEEGQWIIHIHQWNNPMFHVHTNYMEMNELDKETINYLKERKKQLLWLESSIRYRKLHLESVLEILLEKQQAFFDYGPHYLRPLTLRDLADELDVHVSTVSRLFQKKYVQTPYGTFSLQFFLQRSLMKEEGDVVSSYSVKQMIKDIIRKEDPNKPYSDEKVKLLLHETYAVQIARRTVAKYREQLGILSTKYRKKRGN